MNLSIYAQLQEACERVGKTKREGDEAKWAIYNAMSKKGQLEWRLREGHGEYCRLSRLAFHRHI